MPYFALIIMFYHVKIACYQSDRNRGIHKVPRVATSLVVTKD